MLCRGRGCPLRHYVKRRARRVNLRPRIRRVGAGSRLQIRVAAPGYATKVRVFTVSSRGIQVAKRCIPPGTKKLRKRVRLSKTGAVRVFGVLVVRDEVDVVRLCVLHHLTAGCERILVVDNGSSDGTTTVLRRLAKRTPLSWTFDPGPYLQDEFMTGLAGEAVRAGADWVLPLDADEFWTGEADLRTALASRLQSGAVQVRRVDFVQRREQRAPEARAVLAMTMRVAEPSDVTEEAVLSFRAGELSIFEMQPAPKLALRASTELVVPRGAHVAAGSARPDRRGA